MKRVNEMIMDGIAKTHVLLLFNMQISSLLLLSHQQVQKKNEIPDIWENVWENLELKS